MNKAISIVGAPMWLGQACYGANLAPAALRAAGLQKRLTAFNQDIIDLGDIPIAVAGQCEAGEQQVKNLQPIIAASNEIARCVARIVASDRFPLVLGGDHSIAIGTLAGLIGHYDNLGIIWYDAHADINTPATTPSGNIHGMPLAVAMGSGHAELLSIGGAGVRIKPENIVYIGVRDIDPGEAAFIDEQQIKLYTAEDVGRWGMPAIIEQTLAHLAACDGIHLSFDIDGIDPLAMPGVGTPAAGGVSYRDSILALQLLEQSRAVTSAEFVELNPVLDKDGQTTRAVVDLIAAFLGEFTPCGLQRTAAGRREQDPACQGYRLTDKFLCSLD